MTRRLSRQVILACSATKRAELGRAQAVALYDGPAWRTYRANKSCALWPGFALSAEHGLISEYAELEAYDRRLETLDDVARLMDQVAAELERLEGAGELADRVLVYGGARYRQLMLLAIDRAGDARDRYQFTTGGIGQQLGQLAKFLREE